MRYLSSPEGLIWERSTTRVVLNLPGIGQEALEKVTAALNDAREDGRREVAEDFYNAAHRIISAPRS
jgi:hypothetical protein